MTQSTASQQKLFQIQDLSYSYDWNQQKVEVLKKINFELKTASFACIVGPSGSGKTTFLNLLGMIDTPSTGKIEFLGQDVTHMNESEREVFRLKKIGFVFQSFYLIPTLSVMENTAYFLPSLGYSQKQSEQIAKETLHALGLEAHMQKKPLELSGGQRQRVAIARAIAKKPQVVLADEPTANLDSETANTIIKAFKILRDQNQTSFIFSTHDSHLLSFAEQVFKMKDGVLTEDKV